jgi:alkylation response protein AidB-like acyl-CoA dehydrogenase
MQLAYTQEEEAFREDVRTFIREKLPVDIQGKVLEGKHLSRDDYMRWHRLLHGRGWVAPNWPVEHGGADWSPVQRHIFEEEAAEAGAPSVIPFGVVMCGPVIIRFGTGHQKSYFLPRILSGEHVWCQGFSEPGSGSDLASLRSKAVLQGDHYVVDGHKTWTSLAHMADWIFCLVRTDPSARRQQEGITFLLIDLKSPGVTVRPIRTMDGGHEINDVFLDGVKVPAENRIGEENKGWTYAKFLLGHERAIARIGASKRELGKVKEIAARECVNGQPLIARSQFRDKIAALEVELMALEITNLRMIAAIRAGAMSGTESSIIKLKSSVIQQRLTELAVEALGPNALPFQREALEDGWNGEPAGPGYALPVTPQYLNYRKVSIFSGSNEIQRNVISKMGLGL